MTNIDRLWWLRLAQEREQRILLTFRVEALEGKGGRSFEWIELPRTIRDWYELVLSIQKFLFWIGPKIGFVWGVIQNILPLVRGWFGH